MSSLHTAADHESNPPGTMYGSISSSNDERNHVQEENVGSSWVGASFNLTSSILGAGCIGLGGAIANSGGLVSIVSILVFAILSKYSYDLVISLAVESQEIGQERSTSTSSSSSSSSPPPSSYESLGYATYGTTGKNTVIISKWLYSFGCLVAYIVIIKDNFSPAAIYLLQYNTDSDADGTRTGNVDESPSSFLYSTLGNQGLMTVILCTVVMLPLCLLRDLTPLERFSAFKISVLLLIVGIVTYLYLVGIDEDENGYTSTTDEEDSSNKDFVDHWLVIRSGVFESLGTFVFTFVAQHAVHLVFQSIRPSDRTVKEFEKSSTLAIIISTTIALGLGFSIYMTFWENTSSDIFHLYPPSRLINLCRILLCISMLLTYPFPFMTVRELLIISFISTTNQKEKARPNESAEGLLLDQQTSSNNSSSWLIPGQERQLKRKYHIALTITIWTATVILALAAGSLGDVLNLTGCATATVITCILPAIFSYKLRGHTILGSILFCFGGFVGLIGTYYSLLAIL